MLTKIHKKSQPYNPPYNSHEEKIVKRLLLPIFIFLLIAGCANPPKELFKKGCGPFPEYYVELTKCYLNHFLYNPDSLKDFTINKPPEKIKVDTGYRYIPLRKGQEVWEYFIVYDAKNRNGKYIGKDLHVVWIRNNKIIAYDYKDIDIDFSVKQRHGDPCALKEKFKNNS